MSVKRALVFRFRDFPISELLLGGELPAFIDQPCYIYVDKERAVVDPCTAIKEADVDPQSTKALSKLVQALSDLDDNVHRLKYLTGSEDNTILRTGYHVSASFADVVAVLQGQGFQVASAMDYIAARRSDLAQRFPQTTAQHQALSDEHEVAMRLEELELRFDWRGVDLGDDFGHAAQILKAQGFEEGAIWQGGALWLACKEQLGVLRSGSWALHLAKRIAGTHGLDESHTGGVGLVTLSGPCFRSLSILKRPVPERFNRWLTPDVITLTPRRLRHG